MRMKTKRGDRLIGELSVLVMGNNPGDLGAVFEKLSGMRENKIVTEIVFNLKTAINTLRKFNPDFILIDDNIGKVELNDSVKKLLHFRKTKTIPITILKNSNYQEAISSGVLNYVLKSNLNAESLLSALKNSRKFRQTETYLRQAYRKRKGRVLRLIN
jgi:DNA-binding NarL/FixJ family response regulator